jgi:hypothetical protein
MTITRTTRHEVHFGSLGLRERQELQTLCLQLPVITPQAAAAFFAEANRVATIGGQPGEMTLASILSNLGSTLAASDRPDFEVSWDPASPGPGAGVMYIETHDAVIGILQCVARVSNASFLARAYSSNDAEAVKRLRG